MVDKLFIPKKGKVPPESPNPPPPTPMSWQSVVVRLALIGLVIYSVPWLVGLLWLIIREVLK